VAHRIRKNKIIWPSFEELVKDVKETSFCAVAKKLGVTDNAVRKHILKKSFPGSDKANTLDC
jgi:hypothetical protein